MDPMVIGGDVAAGLVGGAMNLAGQGLNYWNTKRLNIQQQEYNTEMYNRQYNDNIKLWRLQNEYNSPENQRLRLVNAGLNPAMMYGGAGGGAGTPAGAIDGAKPMPWNPQVPTMSGDSLLNSLYKLPMSDVTYIEKKARARREELNTQILDMLMSDNALPIQAARAQYNEAIYKARIRHNEWEATRSTEGEDGYYRLRNKMLDAAAKKAASGSNLADAQSVYWQTNMRLFEETGLLLTDDVFYRLNSSERDKVVQQLASIFGMFFQSIPIK